MSDAHRLITALGKTLNTDASERVPSGTLVDVGGDLSELAPELERSFGMGYRCVNELDVVERSVSDVVVALGGASATSSQSLLLAYSLAAEWDAPLVVLAANSGFWPNALGALFGLESVVPPMLRGVTNGDLDAAMVSHDLTYLQTEDVRESADTIARTLSFGIATTSPLASLLRRLRNQTDDSAETSYFVRRIVVGAAIPPRLPQRPFLSVVMRSQGRREQAMREVLTCLEAQTDQDFEIVVIAHNANVLELETIYRVVGDCSESLRQRIRVVETHGGLRSSPLNVGFSAARGRYIASLDDDDSVLGHWVETFRKGSEESPGQIIRTISLKQEVDLISVRGRDAVRAVGAATNPYPATFDFVDHLMGSNTPFHSYGFPAEAFHLLGFRFDEDLSLQEDWDFAMRVAAVFGVHSMPEVTAVYRWWISAESSRTHVNEDEVHRNHQHIRDKFNEHPLLLPADSEQAIWEYSFGPERHMRALAQAEVMLNARGWRATALLRWVALKVVTNASRYPAPHEIVYWSTAQLEQLMHEMRLSLWFRSSSALKHPVRTTARVLARRLRSAPLDYGLRWDAIQTKSSWGKPVALGQSESVSDSSFGNALTAAIIAKVFELDIEWAEPDTCDLLVSGSYLEIAAAEAGANIPSVWGCGFLRNGAQVIKWTRFGFAAVRGRLSLERIDVPWGEAVCVGDPALLASALVVERPEKEFQLGFVAHTTDLGHPFIAELVSLGTDVHVMDTNASPEYVADMIARCEVIISSELFALIIADSLQIPNVHVTLRNNVPEGDYAFEDYYSNFDQARYMPLQIAEVRKLDLKSLVETVKAHHTAIVRLTDIQTRLVNSFPFRKSKADD